MVQIKLTEEQLWGFDKILKEDDLVFYERFLVEQPVEHEKKFFREFPDFLKDYPLNPLGGGRMDLLKDEIYRGIMRKVKRRMEEM